jgi:hypothetical protein
MLHRMRRRKHVSRKMYLFACASWRRVWDLLNGRHARRGVETLERFADGLIPSDDLTPFFEAWDALVLGVARRGSEFLSAQTAYPWEVAIWAQYSAESHVFNHAAGPQANQELHRNQEIRCQAELVRHVFGPLKPTAPIAPVASEALELAGALYGGKHCHFALLEAGHPELARHFREPDHPKGCWALDLILGKK